MRVHLVEPPLSYQHPGVFPRHPPHYAAYAAGLLLGRGHEVELLDAFQRHLSREAIVQEVAAASPDLVLLLPFDYTRETPLELSLELAGLLRARLPGTLLGLAGSTDAAYLEDGLCRQPALDLAVVGEYELPSVGVADALASGAPWREVPGLVVRGRGAELARSAPSPVVEDLDSLPFPAWHLIKFLDYVYIPHRYKYAPFYPLLASRGCPFACLTCKEARVSKITHFRLRSVQNVLEEMRFAVREYGAREIQFSDATFGLDRAWVMELCAALRREGPRLPWSALTRVNLVDAELLRAMAGAGCWNLLYGIESGSEPVLRRIHKGISLEQARRAVAETRAAGIESTASFILGLPGETEADLLRTIDFACQLGPDYAQFFLLKHIGQASDLSRWGRFTGEWDLGEYDFRGPVFIPNAIRDLAQLKQYQRLAYRRFYLRAGYLMRKLPQMVRTGQLRRLVHGGLIALRAAGVRRTSSKSRES